MTEADWLAGKNPERMLAVVADRLSSRRRHLLACAVVRRTWEILPEGELRKALDWCEKHAGKAHADKKIEERIETINAAARTGLELARATQHDIVLSADPDADPESFRATEDDRVNPAAVLFQSACRHAGESVESAGVAVLHAAQAVAMLAMMPPDDAQLDEVRRLVVEATQARTGAGMLASFALKMKALGDEAADADSRRNVNVRYAASLETVTTQDESLTNKLADLNEQKVKADRKALGRILHDLCGNPFKPFRFEPSWRTKTVVGLAKTIYAERLFDRMPILADALLDADCDEEAILRHCRGTELHAPEGAAHGRGCWVLELILKNEPAYFKEAPLEEPKPAPPAPPPPTAGRRSEPAGWDRLLRALEEAGPGEDDEDERPPTPPRTRPG